jgi:purine-binding chemotaxis protein CheW
MSEQPACAAPPGAVERVLVFKIGGQEFALPIESIVEIARFRPPTPVPGARRGILGIVPLRGKMVTVIDGRARVGLEVDPAWRPESIIVLRDAGEFMGLAVGAVVRVAHNAPADGQGLPAVLGIGRPAMFQGAVPRPDGGYVLLLDAALVLRGEG